MSLSLCKRLLWERLISITAFVYANSIDVNQNQQCKSKHSWKYTFLNAFLGNRKLCLFFLERFVGHKF